MPTVYTQVAMCCIQWATVKLACWRTEENRINCLLKDKLFTFVDVGILRAIFIHSFAHSLFLRGWPRRQRLQGSWNTSSFSAPSDSSSCDYETIKLTQYCLCLTYPCIKLLVLSPSLAITTPKCLSSSTCCSITLLTLAYIDLDFWRGIVPWSFWF